MAVTADGLRAAGGVNFDRRIAAAGCHGGGGGGARACARRLRFSHATLEKMRANIVPAVDHDKLDVHTLSEVRIALDFGCVILPVCGELREEDDEVGITHRYRDAVYLPVA